MTVRYVRRSLEVVLVVLVVLKLAGELTWSWWWVLAPLWAPAVVGLLAALVYAACYWLLLSPEERQRRRVARAIEDYAEGLRR